MRPLRRFVLTTDSDPFIDRAHTDLIQDSVELKPYTNPKADRAFWIGGEQYAAAVREMEQRVASEALNADEPRVLCGVDFGWPDTAPAEYSAPGKDSA